MYIASEAMSKYEYELIDSPSPTVFPENTLRSPVCVSMRRIVCVPASSDNTLSDSVSHAREYGSLIGMPVPTVALEILVLSPVERSMAVISKEPGFVTNTRLWAASKIRSWALRITGPAFS